MGKRKYRVRKVVARFMGRHDVPHVLLECGHDQRDPVDTYWGETATHIRVMVRAISGEPQRCQCHKCGRGDPPVTIEDLKEIKRDAYTHAEKLRESGFEEERVKEYLDWKITDADIRILAREQLQDEEKQQ